MDIIINSQAKVSDFISAIKQWNLDNNVLSNYIIEKTSSISIPIIELDAKFI